MSSEDIGRFHGALLQRKRLVGVECSRVARGSWCDRFREGASMGRKNSHFVRVSIMLLLTLSFLCAQLLGVKELGRVSG